MDRPKPISSQVTDERIQRLREGNYTSIQLAWKDKWWKEKRRKEYKRLGEAQKAKLDPPLNNNF